MSFLPHRWSRGRLAEWRSPSSETCPRDYRVTAVKSLGRRAGIPNIAQVAPWSDATVTSFIAWRLRGF